MYIDIGGRREVLWDDYLVDTEKTTAKLTLHKPQRKGRFYDYKDIWQVRGCGYGNLIKLDDTYFLYYKTCMPCADKKELTKDFNKERNILNYLCVMTGKDPDHLTCPSLGICEHEGSTDNNIVMVQKCSNDFEEELDNFFAFVDENPDCPPDERVKAVAQMMNHKKGFPGFRELWSYVSPDGIHFKLNAKISGGDDPHGGLFDSLNTVRYDVEAGVYKAYVRGLHLDYGVAAEAQKTGIITKEMERSLAGFGIRDIRYMESKDFKTWSVPKRISYNDGQDYQLYTNHIQPYARAPHMLIGLPTRYTERKAWTQNYEQLCGEESANWRKSFLNTSPREGLAITDAVFMSSRDGMNWNRFPESFMGGEPEHTYNWRYGDMYLMYGLLETPCEAPQTGTELTLIAEEKTTDAKVSWHRYTLRLDGFASYRADFDIKTLETKPFIFDGSELSINFSTSPIGFCYVDILDETGKPIDGYHSCELFGNTTDRTVFFGDSEDVSKLAGRPVKLRFTMRDADIYSFIFR